MRVHRRIWLLAVVVLLGWGGPALAQDLAVCGGISLSGPPGGRAVDPDYGTSFSWSGEPAGAARSEMVTIPVDARNGTVGDATRRGVKAGERSAFSRGRPGTNTWSVIFYDAGGDPICMTRTQSYTVAETSSSSTSEPATATPAQAAAAATAVQAALGRYIVRLGTDNTFYTGPADRTVDADDYDDAVDADDWRARGYSGLEIYGNQRNNRITGSDLSDLIYGGDESCSTSTCARSIHLGDTIDGGAGDDEIHGGNEACTATGCAYSNAHLGDDITGGAGDDTIYGGDEYCSGTRCAFLSSQVGDNIHGSDGNDTIFGGDEACSGSQCGASGSRIGDAIFGDGDDDTIEAGDNACDGASCSSLNSYIGDEISGGDGNDRIDGGSESCSSSPCSGTVADTLTPSSGSDTVVDAP